MADAPQTPEKWSFNWTDAFPAPRTTAPVLSREGALQGMISEQSSPEFLLVDVRRNDYEGGTIVGSLNLPAHSFYMNRASLHALCKKAGVKRVAFYCGSSNGRGPRCSGWFADYISEQGDGNIQSFTLGGGIKGWVKAGEPYTELIDGFVPEYWKQFD